MSPPLWALSVPLMFGIAVFPRLLAFVMAKKCMGVKFDEANPRDQMASKELAMKDTEGYIRRAIAAHQNGLEALLYWTAAVMLARTTEVPTSEIDAEAAWFLGLRFLYVFVYIFVSRTNATGKIRTLSFAASMVPVVRLVASAVFRA